MAGTALGFGGTDLVAAVAPKLSATLANHGDGAAHTVAVHFAAHITATWTALGVVLALAGSLIAGSLGGWRAARLQTRQGPGPGGMTGAAHRPIREIEKGTSCIR